MVRRPLGGFLQLGSSGVILAARSTPGGRVSCDRIQYGSVSVSNGVIGAAVLHIGVSPT